MFMKKSWKTVNNVLLVWFFNVSSSLTIDTQFGTSVEVISLPTPTDLVTSMDCLERISIGEKLPTIAIYRNITELMLRECEKICKNDKQCLSFSYGVGPKGNATCRLSHESEQAIRNISLEKDPNYHVYVRRINCEQPAPKPLKPQDGQTLRPQDEQIRPNRPVYRPEIDDNMNGNQHFDTEIPRPYSSNNQRPNDKYDPNKPNPFAYGFLKPNNYYGHPSANYDDRPDDSHSYNKPNNDQPQSYGDFKPHDTLYIPQMQNNHRPNTGYNTHKRPYYDHDELNFKPQQIGFMPHTSNLDTSYYRPFYGIQNNQHSSYQNKPTDNADFTSYDQQYKPQHHINYQLNNHNSISSLSYYQPGHVNAPLEKPHYGNSIYSHNKPNPYDAPNNSYDSNFDSNYVHTYGTVSTSTSRPTYTESYQNTGYGDMNFIAPSHIYSHNIVDQNRPYYNPSTVLSSFTENYKPSSGYDHGPQDNNIQRPNYNYLDKPHYESDQYIYLEINDPQKPHKPSRPSYNVDNHLSFAEPSSYHGGNINNRPDDPNSYYQYGDDSGGYKDNHRKKGENKPQYGGNAYTTKPNYDIKPNHDSSLDSSNYKPANSYQKPSSQFHIDGYTDQSIWNRPANNDRPIYKPISTDYYKPKPVFGYHEDTATTKPSYNLDFDALDNRYKPISSKPITSLQTTESYHYKNQNVYGETTNNPNRYGNEFKNNFRPDPDNKQDYNSNHGGKPDVKPVYDIYDKSSSYGKPEVVYSKPVSVSGVGASSKPGHFSLDACFRRVLAGKRALRSLVRRVVACESLRECQRECAEEFRFHCESFNYRLDHSLRGRGLCELMTKPIEAFDMNRDFVEDKDFDFYELDRNSLQPNCPVNFKGPFYPHSGFLGGSHGYRPSYHGSSSAVTGYEGNSNNGHNYHGSTGSYWPARPTHHGNGFSKPDYHERPDYDSRHYEERRYHHHKPSKRPWDENFVPYRIGIGRSNEDDSWGQYGGLYGGFNQYYADKTDLDNSIDYWGLKPEKPLSLFGKPYDVPTGFDYYSLGSKYEEPWDKYSYGAKPQKKWNYSGFDNGLALEESNYYGPGYRKDYKQHHVEERFQGSEYDCSSRRKAGMSLGSAVIRRSLLAHTVVECETACFNEREFKCVSYSYRYSDSLDSDNCFLSEVPYSGASLTSDTGSDVYSMQDHHFCASPKPVVESECFWHVRSGKAISPEAIKLSLTVAGLGACEAECIRARGFFCRGFSFRFESPTIGDEVENCLLTSTPPASLEPGAGLHAAKGHELYARGNYGRGCEPVVSDGGHKEKSCYLQYESAARLLPSAVRGRATLPDEEACSSACTEAPFSCLSFSFSSRAPQGVDNCLMSDIRLFDLHLGVDYEHHDGDWLFAYDMFNKDCWKKTKPGDAIDRHGFEEHSPELPRPLVPSGPSGPDAGGSGPAGPVNKGPVFIPIPQPPPTFPSGPTYPSGPSAPEFPHQVFSPAFTPAPFPNNHHRPRPDDHAVSRPGDHGMARPGYLPIDDQSLSLRHYTVSGFPCRRGTQCAQNHVAGHWSCEPEGGEVGSWDYCCAPTHNCGYSEGFHKPWCYVGPAHDQWRPCSEKYYPYHQHSGPHPSQGQTGHYGSNGQSHRKPGSWSRPDRPSRPIDRPYHPNQPADRPYHPDQPADRPYHPDQPADRPYHPNQPADRPYHPNEPADRPYRPHQPADHSYLPLEEYNQKPVVPSRPYLPEADRRYWDSLYKNGPQAYYDEHGNPLPGYLRIPTVDRYSQHHFDNPHIQDQSWSPLASFEEELDPPIPGGFGVARYWPVAYLHKGPPPNMTYFEYNPEEPIKQKRPYQSPSLTNDTQDKFKKDEIDRNDRMNTNSVEPLVKNYRDEKTRNITDDHPEQNTTVTNFIKVSSSDDFKNESSKVIENDSNDNVSATNESIDSEKPKLKINDKLEDFSKSIEVLNIEDANKGEKDSETKMLEAEERQIEEIGRLLASKRNGHFILEKRSQSDFERQNIRISKEPSMDDASLNSQFLHKSPRIERRGIVQKVPKPQRLQEFKEKTNSDKSLEASETSHLKIDQGDIKKKIIDGKIFFDATIKDEKPTYATVLQPTVRATNEIKNTSETTNIPTSSTLSYGLKTLKRRTTINPLRQSRRLYRRRYNPEEVRKRLLDKEKAV